MKFITALLIVAGLWSTGLGQIPTNALTPKSFRWKVSGRVRYLLYLPQGYAQDKQKEWPLMLFLHGAGERGSDLQKVTVHGPPKLVREGRQFPFILVAPLCPKDDIWDREPLIQLLDNVEKNLRVDRQRVYLAGLSMGGYGAWELGVSYPSRFAAVIPISGGGNFIDVLLVKPSQRKALKTLPVWAFHGAKDPTVPVRESERMVDMLRHLGDKHVKLTIYPDAEHDAWTRTFENRELYKWMLSQVRTNAG